MELLILVAQILILIGFSAMCSGLNVSLMSLGIADLRRKAKLGNAQAKRVLPLRTNYHLTLASILLVNVGAVSATSLVLETKMNGVLAGITSTLLIVVFAEIAPQAFFSRYALTFCSFLAPTIRLMIFLTYPVSRPLQLILDKTFGHPATELETRHELGILIGEHLVNSDSELDNDEVEIMRGALSLSEKRVRDIMKPIRKVYWLTPDTIINARKIEQIKSKAWSRIPVFNHSLTKVYGVLLMKDLVDMDFDTEIVAVKDLTLYPTEAVGSMTALDTMFRKFINAQTHLLPIERDSKIVGIVTIEDLLEEIVGHEIEDESDRDRASKHY
jgi:metal transporter CNNM